MGKPSWFLDLDRVHSSYLVLAVLAVLGLAVGALSQAGLLAWAVRVAGAAVRGGIRRGFLLWERLFAWAPWPAFLVVVGAVLGLGWVAGGFLPGLRVLCGLSMLLMGTTAC